jgi:hypothetical protein
MAFLDPPPAKELIAIIRGEWNSKGGSVSEISETQSGLHLTGTLQSRYREFANTHEIIDVQPVHESVENEIVLVVRYKP